MRDDFHRNGDIDGCLMVNSSRQLSHVQGIAVGPESMHDLLGRPPLSEVADEIRRIADSVLAIDRPVLAPSIDLVSSQLPSP